ncbi:FadR/GntR family transcriptional regulator [Microvirga massiliensis]|uniref:FadR/GntR family transcriptional regulator n=1 Tax=Microvirga massiliensis TaxID=1033741 RepID=UPI00062BD307|nr:FCD domain-containing protein [Microvirga massiliensis]
MASKAAQKPTAAVHEFIDRAISSGAYKAGSKLPTERALAEALRVPRSAVRDALSVFEAQKRVVRVIGSGTYVAAPGHASMPQGDDVLRDISPAEVMAARLVLEPRIVLLVVTNATAADFARMEECNREAERAETAEEFERWDAALHKVIADASHNRLIVDLYDRITAARDCAEWGDLKHRSMTPERRAKYQSEHLEIVAALRARDAVRAEAALTRHVYSVRDNHFSGIPSLATGNSLE